MSQNTIHNEPQPLKDGEPCEHRGCLNHIAHPCEGCGRIGGLAERIRYERESAVLEYQQSQMNGK